MNLNDYISIIGAEISPGRDAVVGKILGWYIDRTMRHVESVREFGRKALDACAGEDWNCLLRVNLLSHDRDKLSDGEFIAHYAPYIVKRYCNDGLQDEFELTDEYRKLWDERYVVQHCLRNGHHPEHWDRNYSYGENHPPYDATAMPQEYVAEMCCDWCAVGLEQGNSAMDWFQKVNRTRYRFSGWQERFISWLIREIES